MFRPLGMALLLCAAGCGGSDGGPSSTRKPVKLSAPARTIVETYGSGKFSADELREAVFQECGEVRGASDIDRVRDVLRTLLNLPASPARAAAEQAVVEVVTAGLATFPSATQQSWDTIQRVGQINHAGLARAALQAFLRLDRAAAEKAIFEESFAHLTEMPKSSVMWFPPDAAIGLARELDAPRARKALETWMDRVAQRPRTESLHTVHAGPAVQALLDLDPSKAAYLKVLAHPLFYRVGATGFLHHYAQARQGRFKLDDNDRAEVMLGALRGGTEHVFPASIEPFLGKAFGSSGEPLAKVLEKFFAGYDAPKKGITGGWGPFITPALLSLDEAQLVGVFRSAAGSAPGRTALRAFLFPGVHIPEEKHGPLIRAFCEIVGRDPKEDEYWLHSLQVYRAPQVANDLAKALARSDLSLGALREGIKAVISFGDVSLLAPAIRRRLRDPGTKLQETLELFRGWVPEKFEPLAPDLIESFLREEGYRGSARVDVVKLGRRADYAPRLVSILARVKEETTRKEIFHILHAFADRRIVKALVDLAPPRSAPGARREDLWQGLLVSLGGQSMKDDETYAQYYERVRPLLPAQVAPIDTPLGEAVSEVRVVQEPPPKAPAPASAPPRTVEAPKATPAPAGQPVLGTAPARAIARETPRSGPPGTLLYSTREAKPPPGTLGVVSDDVLLLGGQGSLSAVDLLTGKLLWTRTGGTQHLGTSGDQTNWLSGGTVAAVSKSDGRTIWTREMAVSPMSGVTAGGRIVISGRGVYALDAATGKTAWTWQTAETSIHSSYMVLTGGDDGVLLQTNPKTKGAYDLAWADPKTGQEKWTLAGAEGVTLAHFARRHGDLLVVLRGKDSTEMDVKTGKSLFESKGRYISFCSERYRVVRGVAEGFDVMHRPSGATAWSVPQGTIYHASESLILYRQGTELVRADLGNGKAEWKADPGLSKPATAFIVDKTVVAHDGSQVVGLDLQTGKPLWKQGVAGFDAKANGGTGVKGRAVFWATGPLRLFAVSASPEK